MNVVALLKRTSAIIFCVGLLTACTPSVQNEVMITTESNGIVTTAGTLSVTTATTTTSVSKTIVQKNENTTTTTTTNTDPTISKSSYLKERKSSDKNRIFDFTSTDYSVLKQWIQEDFPEEKSLDEFVAFYSGYDEDNTLAQHHVAFLRYINGCQTESRYSLYFDDNGLFLFYWYDSPEYDPSKVKPPRVATEEEIEAAKKDSASKLQSNYILTKQQVGNSRYIIREDKNIFPILTSYSLRNVLEFEGYFDESSPNYGKEYPTFGSQSLSYTIER